MSRRELRNYGKLFEPRFESVFPAASPYSVAQGDFLIGCAGTTVNLPAASANPGRVIAVKQLISGISTVTPAGADTIDGAASFLVNGDGQTVLFQSDGGSSWRVLAGWPSPAGIVVSLGGVIPATPVPTWYKVNFSHTDFQIGATTRTITLCQLPGGGIIHGSKVKHSLAFLGGAISAYTLKIGDNTVLDKYLAAFNVFAAAANSNFGLANNFDSFDQSAAQIVSIAAASTGANLSASTQGTGSAWVQVSKAV